MTASILMFCPQFRPIVGGAERQAEKLAKALAHKGVRVTVLTPRLVLDTPEHEEDAGVVVHRFPLFDLCRRLPGVRGLGPLNLLLIRAQVIRAINRYLDSIDVVHMHIAAPMTAFAMQAARTKGIPVLCKVANAGPPDDLQRLNEIGISGNLLRRSMIRSLDCWVATTHAVRDVLHKWGVASQKIATIANGVSLVGDVPPTTNNGGGRVRRFLYLGRLSSNIQRDVPNLIRAFERLADQNSYTELALVGDGDLYYETAALVSQTRNRQRIQMPGLQKPETWLRWADCFVLPSRREGLSNALLEAMAHGLPCIANDIPPNREVLDDGKAGILVPVGDEDRLYLEMKRMATESGQADAMGCAALERVQERYSIEAVADRYITLYEELIRNSGK